MRLTKTLRDSFIKAVMTDVPTVDHREEMRKLILADAINGLPPAAAKLWEDPKTRGYLRQEYHSYHGVCVQIPYHCHEGFRRENLRPLTPEIEAQVAALAEAHRTQDKTRQDLYQKLKSAAYACSTRKQLAELLPEFASYLPVDENKAIINNLPVVANLLSDFVKAGWPKHLKRPIKKPPNVELTCAVTGQSGKSEGGTRTTAKGCSNGY